MMKVVLAAIMLMSSYVGFSQNTKEASVEKSVFGVQVGLIGIWAHHELKLSNEVALRTEFGIAGVNTADIDPLVALETRWYYNLQKRADSNKRIDGNSGNYFSLRAGYRFFDIKNNDNRDRDYFMLVPTWGIRRNLRDHFNYEAGIGAGLGLFYDNGNTIGLTTYVNLKIGYRF